MTVLTLRNTLRAAAVALAMGGTVVTAMPVQAASSPNVEFHFSIGNGGGKHWDGGRPDRHCMSDPQVRRDLRRDGYRNIRFIDRRGRIVHVIARKGGRTYQIAYDSCRGRIVDRDRLWR